MRQDGAVLISILVFLALVSMAAALELPGVLERDGRLLDRRSESRLARAATAAEEQRIHSGNFPADLDALAAEANLPDRWRRDPFEPSAEMDLVDGGDRLELRFRGEDRSLASADDRIELRSDRLAARARTRNRLRLYRAVFFASDRCRAPTMSAAEVAALRDLWGELFPLMRSRIYLPPAGLLAADARIAQLRAGIQALQAGHKIKKVPGNARGLLAILKLPVHGDEDGYGRRFEVDDLGFFSLGRDGTGGTVDDF